MESFWFYRIDSKLRLTIINFYHKKERENIMIIIFIQVFQQEAKVKL